MENTEQLHEYIISYSKLGYSTPLTPAGLKTFREEMQAMKLIAAVGTDYDARVFAVSSLTAISFMTRPNEETLAIHRVWSDKVAGDEFYTVNDTTVFENFRKNGWEVTWTSRPFDFNDLNGSDIEII